MAFDKHTGEIVVDVFCGHAVDEVAAGNNGRFDDSHLRFRRPTCTIDRGIEDSVNGSLHVALHHGDRTINVCVLEALLQIGHGIQIRFGQAKKELCPFEFVHV